MDTADFYLINGPQIEWIGSTTKKGSPYDIPSDILIQKDSLNYVVETELFLYDNKDGITEKLGWPHMWADSRMTEYVYYFFSSMNEVLFSMREDNHKILYDPIEIKKGNDLKAAKRLRLNREFPKMRLLVEVKNGSNITKAI